MNASLTTTAAWGPLAEPIHTDAAAPGDPVWKDNAYLSFWDTDAEVFGTLHVSTSPNDERGRRTRCSMSAGGRTAEIIERLEPGSFTSSSIDFGLDGVVRVEHPDLTLELTNTPLFVPADYAVGGLIPELVPGKPLQHYQQGCAIAGTATFADGTTHTFQGYGMRDRTWGFRDESAQWIEYAGLIAVSEDSFLTAMKFLGADGTVRGDGFYITGESSTPITGIAFARDAAAQFVRATLTLADGSEHVAHLADRAAGFWVPMGAASEGPAFGTYDDFMRLVLDGRPGAGLFEQGILHRVW
ncbi:hypothetical protein [Nocardia sp. NPDC004711]